ncbi:MAG: transglutaminase domain-containing protein [Flavobacterium sp.]|nr:MAG: transglutaminase domain-containing protein [Flavobacterium sp.]
MEIKQIKTKLAWIVRRHPLLYYIRFLLISRNYKENPLHLPAFNDINNPADADSLFYEVNSEIDIANGADEVDKSLAIARFLYTKHKYRGRGLGLSSNKSLRLIYNREAGVCSDHSQIFNVFCLINNIKVREWGIVDKLYRSDYGHTFNEIYSARLQKWIMIDVWKGILFTDGVPGSVPFSAVELFLHLRNGNALHFVQFVDKLTGEDRIYKLYSAKTIPFLIDNYDNKVYDHYLNKYQDRYPSFLINAFLILLGKNYRFLFPLDNYKEKLLNAFKS